MRYYDDVYRVVIGFAPTLKTVLKVQWTNELDCKKCA